MIRNTSFQQVGNFFPRGRRKCPGRYGCRQHTAGLPVARRVVIRPAIIRPTLAAAIEDRETASGLWHLNVCVDSQLVHPISFKMTNIAESDKTTPANRCNQLSARRRQFVHLTCHNGRTVPQFEHDQITVGIGNSLLLFRDPKWREQLDRQ